MLNILQERTRIQLFTFLVTARPWRKLASKRAFTVIIYMEALRQAENHAESLCGVDSNGFDALFNLPTNILSFIAPSTTSLQSAKTSKGLSEMWTISQGNRFAKNAKNANFLNLGVVTILGRSLSTT